MIFIFFAAKLAHYAIIVANICQRYGHFLYRQTKFTTQTFITIRKIVVYVLF